jgi:sialate O-acetylesterase
LDGCFALSQRRGGPYEMTLSANSYHIVLKNILIGDVWLCSGQSNMELPMETTNTKELIAKLITLL